ncbi:hypothetical protein SDC9_210258 [bioreactor metagenome]|uniref:Uncharacterized protein n=1 Tax=bioreactor metagenome TaxID=1076179 RepID=A0A645JII8_9ZZZZ
MKCGGRHDEHGGVNQAGHAHGDKDVHQFIFEQFLQQAGLFYHHPSLGQR